jgi:hypothetical protein
MDIFHDLVPVGHGVLLSGRPLSHDSTLML